jgi:hypothetical protein
MKNIVWIASYPKSGNTWFRIFMANYLKDPKEPLNINEIDFASIASARTSLDDFMGYNSLVHSHEECDEARRAMYLDEAVRAPALIYHKVHDASIRLRTGELLFPSEATKCVVYIVRNPLDVCVSYAHHTGKKEYAYTARLLCKDGYQICGSIKKGHLQLRQCLGDWSAHVKSWTENSEYTLYLMKYEDMKARPYEIFKGAIDALGIGFDQARFEKALKFSSFDELQRQEKITGFRERVNINATFFRAGTAGAGRSLPPESSEMLIQKHRIVMQQLGYL